MKIDKSTILSHPSAGRITLQVPEWSLFTDPKAAQDAEPTENHPDEFFMEMKRAGAALRPAVGREEGYIYLTRKGWEFFKADIEKAFKSVANPRGTWAEFEGYAAAHFEEAERARQRFIKTTQAKLDEMKKARV